MILSVRAQLSCTVSLLSPHPPPSPLNCKSSGRTEGTGRRTGRLRSRCNSTLESPPAAVVVQGALVFVPLWCPTEGVPFQSHRWHSPGWAHLGLAVSQSCHICSDLSGPRTWADFPRPWAWLLVWETWVVMPPLGSTWWLHKIFVKCFS